MFEIYFNLQVNNKIMKLKNNQVKFGFRIILKKMAIN